MTDVIDAHKGEVIRLRWLEASRCDVAHWPPAASLLSPRLCGRSILISAGTDGVMKVTRHVSRRRKRRSRAVCAQRWSFNFAKGE